MAKIVLFPKWRQHMDKSGTMLPDADLQIAATALYHGLELVTGNLIHFRRINGLQVNAVLAKSRKSK